MSTAAALAPLPTTGRGACAGRLMGACSLWVAAVLLAGCASLRTPAPAADAPVWRGRLALQVDGVSAQSLSGAFELRGTPAQGVLMIFSPLGTTLAQLDWSDAAATLTAQGETRRFHSLDAMLLELTGTTVPVTALFDWLSGAPTAVAGWRADVSGAAQGRLRARRDSPLPAAELRIVLDAPAQ